MAWIIACSGAVTSRLSGQPGKGWQDCLASVSPCLHRSAGDIEHAARGRNSRPWTAGVAFARPGAATTAAPTQPRHSPPSRYSATRNRPATDEEPRVLYPSAPRSRSASLPNPARYSARSPVRASASSTTPSCRRGATLRGQHSATRGRRWPAGQECSRV